MRLTGDGYRMNVTCANARLLRIKFASEGQSLLRLFDYTHAQADVVERCDAGAGKPRPSAGQGHSRGLREAHGGQGGGQRW